jgi:hypothetical protein
MLRFAPLVILLAGLPAGAPRQVPGAANTASDTVQAGDPVVDASRLHPFSIERRLTLARGDSTVPFGRQSEQLTSDTLDGRPVYLDVLTFETPRATTVDSSWIDAATLQPLRMHSSNKARVVTLEFDGRRVRGRTVPAEGDPTSVDEELAVRPFEWNMFGLAVSALPLRPGYRATMPVYVDRFGSVIWYTVEVVRDTTLVRVSGFRAPMWEILATGDSVAPTARLWVSQRHRFVDRALLTEPGVSMTYARE